MVKKGLPSPVQAWRSPTMCTQLSWEASSVRAGLSPPLSGLNSLFLGLGGGYRKGVVAFSRRI